MENHKVSDSLFTWNPPAPTHVGQVTVEDDTLRDGLQGAFIRRIGVEQKVLVLRGCAEVGIDYSIVGFPAISDDEFGHCKTLIEAIEREKLRVVPLCLARTAIEDLAPIVRLNRECEIPVWAELFLGVSPLRRQVEGWTVQDNLDRLVRSAEYLAKEGVHFGLSVEDATRTPPDEIVPVIELMVKYGADRLTLCDTVGESTPGGARALTQVARKTLDDKGAKTALSWHGHNDKGLAVACTIAAVEAGADSVSGTFLGLGERAGNAALEQVLTYLHLGGSRRFAMDKIPALLEMLSSFTGTPIPPTTPIVGAQAFATTAGVHSSALLKARKLGPDFEDFVYSGVPATIFGRSQAVLLGPTSGLANARHALELRGHAPDDEAARELLAHAKTLDRFMSPEEIAGYLERRAPPT